MKYIIILTLLSFNAHAAEVYLQSCEYKYVEDLYKYKYVGTYRSINGYYYTFMFDDYCPQTTSL